MNETVVTIIVIAIIALVLLGWLLYLAAGLVLAFTAFVMGLPTIVAILMFILFPPTLIAYLAGLAFIQLGVNGALARSEPEQIEESSLHSASSTNYQLSQTINTKNHDDIKQDKSLLRTKIPEGLGGLDWLAKYVKSEEQAESISVGPRVVITSFGGFEKGDIAHLRAIGRATGYLNGIAVEKSVLAKNTRPVDESGLIPHTKNA